MARRSPRRVRQSSRKPVMRRPSRPSLRREARRTARQAEVDSAEQRIARRLEDSLRLCAAEPDRIAGRLRELDEEKSLEAAMACGCSALAFGGTVLGLGGRRRWLLLAALASGLLIREQSRGDRPPLAGLRRLGLRLAREIDRERTALKLLRGDFGQLAGETADDLAAAALKAVGR